MTTFHRRRLPHIHATGEPIFLTWRLHGSLPSHRRFPEASAGKAFFAMDRILDAAATGPRYLLRPEFAKLVVDAIDYQERSLGEYQVHSFAVMANHIHLLITPRIPVSKIMQSLKRFTAREGNRMLGLTGQPFWQDESYDHLVRNREELNRIMRYIEMNPVNAGLVAAPEEFRWSSAWPIANRPQDAILPH